MTAPRSAPLVVHVIHRLSIGGLENGLVNLINRMPEQRYRHAIVCLTDFTDFRHRIRRPDVPIYALHKRPGQDWGLYWRLWRLLRRLQPEIVHTRNLGTLEAQIPAWLAGVGCRVHGEHGWNVAGPASVSARHHQLQRLLRPLISHYVALSSEIRDYLQQTVGVPPERISQICNGVDSRRFQPGRDRQALPEGFAPPGTSVIGTVGRLQTVKDQSNLVRAFAELVDRQPERGCRLRLVLVGDGPQRDEVESLIARTGLEEQIWLAGDRNDIPRLLQALDLFVLPSLAEGISNTLLEAMASGLPVVATRVGGNGDLVREGITGRLVAAGDSAALAAALSDCLYNPALLAEQGRAGRRRVEQTFSMEAMVDNYLRVYDRVLGCDSESLPLRSRT